MNIFQRIRNIFLQIKGKLIRYPSYQKIKFWEYKTKGETNISFFKQLVRLSLRSIIWAFILLFIFILFDYLVRLLFNELGNSYNPVLCQIHTNWALIKNSIQIKKFDYFIEVVNIIAGILGVLLGLFFTSFLTIVSTKYSNVNSVVRGIVFREKTINKYFQFLSFLTTFSILFQLSLAFGYKPTPVTILIFVFLVFSSLLSFVNLGIQTISLSDRSYLVQDVINRFRNIYTTVGEQEQNISKLNHEERYRSKIIFELNNLETIIEECRDESQNDSLEILGRKLNELIINYYIQKSNLPSTKNWVFQIQEYKAWEEAKSFELKTALATGTSLYPTTKSDSNYVDKRLIFILSNFLKDYLPRRKKIDVFYNFQSIIPLLAHQYDDEIFEFYFKNMEDVIMSHLAKLEKDGIYSKLNFHVLSMQSVLLGSYLVELNKNLSILSLKLLEDLAKNIYDKKPFNNSIPIPYFLRECRDNYVAKIQLDAYYSGEKATPLFYLKNEVAFTVNSRIQNHYFYIAKYTSNIYSRLARILLEKKQFVGVLILSLNHLEIANKLINFNNSINQKVSELNQLNFQNDYQFKYEKRTEVILLVDNYRKLVIENLWERCASAYMDHFENMPDLFGMAYNFILSDMEDKLFSNNEIAKYLRKYIAITSIYIEKIRAKSNQDNFETIASRYYPIIVDLFDICSIAMIIDEVKGHHINRDIIHDYFNGLYETIESEKLSWKNILNIYSYFNQPLLALNTNSYTKEHKRERQLLGYLTNNNIYFEEHDFFDAKIKTHSKGIIINVLKNCIYNNSLFTGKLREVFIEHFLKCRLSNKEIVDINTKYGGQLQRYMAKTLG